MDLIKVGRAMIEASKTYKDIAEMYRANGLDNTKFLKVSEDYYKMGCDLLTELSTGEFDRTLHLLACLTEEAGEISQIIGKSIRFGLDDHHPKTGDVPNYINLEVEYNDLIAVGEMLGLKIDRKLIQKKKNKVEHFIQYSQEKAKNIQLK